MDKIEVGKTIIKYTGVLTDAECDFLCEFIKTETDYDVEDLNQVPWDMGEKSNVIYFPTIQNQKVREIIKKYKNNLALTISNDMGVKVYPHLTTLVLWKPGQQMPRHVDNGNGFNRKDLTMRLITSVSYMNDNYEGGYTFIRNDGVNDHLWRSDPKFSFPNDVFEDYLSKPEKGATIAFYADDSNAHGVTKLESGERVILSTWFTDQEEYKENDEIILKREQENNSINPQNSDVYEQINQEHQIQKSQIEQTWLRNK
jgi:hypothetical protein